MANLSPLGKRKFEDLFGMASGYVMRFSNSSFERFFIDTANVNIYDKKYSRIGESKANRMREFWRIEPNELVGKVLSEMLELWEYENSGTKNNSNYRDCQRIVSCLLGNENEIDSEKGFLEKNFGSPSFKNLLMDAAMDPIIQNRYKEALSCLKNKNAPLSVIFMCGSILEGILLGTALKNANDFINTPCSPKDKQGKPIPLQDWKLGNLIDAACQLNLLSQDVKKFSHALRDFRNYIHPYMQMSSKFNPDQNTAKICMQVLLAAIADLSGEREN